MSTSSDEHKQILRKNKPDLAENISLAGRLYSHLDADGILSHVVIENIKSEPTEYKQKEKLVQELRQRPRETFELFCEALVKDGQKHIVKLYLKPNDTQRTEGSRAVHPDGNEANCMPDIKISIVHREDDNQDELARNLQEHLINEIANCRCEIALLDATPGKYVLDEICRSIDEADCVVTLINDQFHTDGFAEFKMHMAIMQHLENPERLKSVIPVLVEEAAIPRPFENRVPVEFNSSIWSDVQERYKRKLMKGIKDVVGDVAMPQDQEPQQAAQDAMPQSPEPQQAARDAMLQAQELQQAAHAGRPNNPGSNAKGKKGDGYKKFIWCGVAVGVLFILGCVLTRRVPVKFQVEKLISIQS